MIKNFLFPAALLLTLLPINAFAIDSRSGSHFDKEPEHGTDCILIPATNLPSQIRLNLPEQPRSIICNTLSANGTGSFYVSHTFYLPQENEAPTDCNWSFYLKDKQGEPKLICSTLSGTFTIPEISAPEDYFINPEGELEGRIECEYTLNGEKLSATPFDISLELKPIILNIDDLSVHNTIDYSFSVSFTVQYAGADYVTVEVEEEYNTTLRDYRFYGPDIAHVKTGNISNLYYSWVSVRVSNKYGSDSQTLEFPPVQDPTGVENTPLTEASDSFSDSQSDSHIVLYTINGAPVFQGSRSDFSGRTFDPGLYIKEETFANGQVKTTKILF